MRKNMSIKSESIEIANLQDTLTPFGVCFSGIYMRSFAYIALKDRIPVILTKVIDALSCDKEEIAKTYGQNALEEIKQVVGFISQLKNEIVTNKPMKALPTLENDSDNDATVWNQTLEKKIENEGTTPTWFNTVFLYSECCIYRTLAQKFLLMNALRFYDPFGKQKRDIFVTSLDSIKLISKHLLDIVDRAKLIEEAERKREFFRLIKLNLWGNRCDLSLTAGTKCSSNDNPLEHLVVLDNDIIHDDTDLAWQLLKIQKSNDSNIIDMVLDNAGYELFTDLCLAIFLVNFGFAKKIRFYVKRYPWFVSDTIISDFHWTLEYMKTASDPDLQRIAKLSYDYLENKTWTIEVESFWTNPYDFAEMKEKDKMLYAKLSDAKLVIFKGDLNYRKLMGDINWEYTTSFIKSLRGFHPTNILSLRTVKSDVCVGLLPGQAEMLFDKDKNWMSTGQYGVVQTTLESTCNCSTTSC